MRRQSARRGAAAVRAPNLPRAGGPVSGGLQWLSRSQSAAVPPQRRRWRRRMQRIRHGLALVLALGVLGGMVFGGLLLVTPSVADALSRVRALDSAHGVPYSASPVPERFAAALGKTPLSRYLARILYARGRSGTLASAEVYLLAIKLDMKYPAPRILTMYANVAYFGHGWYGLDAASCGYFGISPERLSRAQAATLAGALSAPASRSSAFALRPAGRLLFHLANGAFACKPGRHRTS